MLLTLESLSRPHENRGRIDDEHRRSGLVASIVSHAEGNFEELLPEFPSLLADQGKDGVPRILDPPPVSAGESPVSFRIRLREAAGNETVLSLALLVVGAGPVDDRMAR
ncbi:Uncharacterised protein [Mycobacteroides abscessus subsp. abscessus]|nr:Uncharacterised protein [Mycobacteroides abscessus subsp. abscessus]